MDALPIPHRDKLLLAYACVEWAAALTHLSALRQVGVRVSEDIITMLCDELTSFTRLWSDVHGESWELEESADHAKAWLAKHVEELDELLKEVGVSDRKTH